MEPLMITYYRGAWSSVNRSLTKDPAAIVYALGLKPPNYPVPAIRMHYEWGRDLTTGNVVLLECIQGPYEVTNVPPIHKPG